jgi:hypothetical protein
MSTNLRGLGVPSFHSPYWKSDYAPGAEHKISVGWVNKGPFFWNHGVRRGEYPKNPKNSKRKTLRTHRMGR